MVKSYNSPVFLGIIDRYFVDKKYCAVEKQVLHLGGKFPS